MRAIQDSESSVAREMKKMIRTLIAQGWSKNEIVFEMQRIYGNDILITPEKLDDTRSLLGRFRPVITLGVTFSAMIILYRMRKLHSLNVARQVSLN